MTAMLRFGLRIARRLGLYVGMLLASSLVVFLLLRVLPGDVAAVIAGTNSTREQYEAIRMQLGLDKPLIVQYFTWLGQMLTGNLGVSVVTGQSMAARLAARSLVTFPLIVMSMIIALVVGVSTAVVSVTHRWAWVRQGVRTVSLIVGAIPALGMGLLLILVLGKGQGIIGILPTQGFPDRPFTSVQSTVTALASLLLPALCAGLITGAHIMRYTRSALIKVGDSDYISWSMASGMTYSQAVRTTGLRLALPQLISVSSVTFASMVTGVLTLETLSALPGMSSVLVADISQRDLPAVQTELFLLTAFFLIVGGLADVMGYLVDPAVHRSQQWGGTR